MKLNLLVLRCANIDLSRSFYESLNLCFTEEKHGTGPRHYSCQIGEVVLELYPNGKKSTNGLRLGLSIGNLNEFIQKVRTLGGEVISEQPTVVSDPDGHIIELTAA